MTDAKQNILVGGVVLAVLVVLVLLWLFFLQPEPEALQEPLPTTAVLSQLPTVPPTAIVVHSPTADAEATAQETATFVAETTPTASPTAPPQPTPTLTIDHWQLTIDNYFPLPNWQPSLLNGDLTTNYPLQRTTPNETAVLHHQPNTYPAANIDRLAALTDQIIADLTQTLGRPIGRPVDVYLGGTLFGSNPGLGGLAQSYEFRLFVRLDGAAAEGEMSYILAHELTHIAATRSFGPYSTPMLHEGLAVYLPYRYLEEAGYLPLNEICATIWQTAAFQSAVQLNTFGYGGNGFTGHTNSYVNYMLSGCFVGYLAETYGLSSVDAVYETGGFAAVYGRSLADLDAEWQDSLATVTPTVDPARFMQLNDEIAAANARYLAASPGGIHADYDAYLRLSAARLALNQGHLDQAQTELAAFRDHLIDN